MNTPERQTNKYINLANRKNSKDKDFNANQRTRD